MSAQVTELEYLKREIVFVESHLRWYAKACSALAKAGRYTADNTHPVVGCVLLMWGPTCCGACN